MWEKVKGGRSAQGNRRWEGAGSIHVEWGKEHGWCTCLPSTDPCRIAEALLNNSQLQLSRTDSLCSVFPAQETPTACLPWTTSAAPWPWTASWTEKTRCIRQDSRSQSRWIVERLMAGERGGSAQRRPETTSTAASSGSRNRFNMMVH